MKKGFTLIELITVIILLGLISLIVVPVVSNTIRNSREDAYNAQIAQIKEAANKWSVANPHLLPDIDSDDYTIIRVNELIKDGYIENTNNGVIINPKDEKENIDGCVKVLYSKNYKQYEYIYTDDCPPTISDVTIKMINDQSDTPKIEEVSFLKGDKTTNYVWFRGYLWRILGRDNNGNVKLITEENVAVIPWGNNSTKTYGSSYLYDWLNTYFLPNIDDNKGTILTTNWCENEASNLMTGPKRTTCSSNNLMAKVGTLTIDEYNLTSTGYDSGFLFNIQNFWTSSFYTNSESSTSYPSIWKVANSSSTNYNSDQNYEGVRPVIKVQATTIITSGSGTASNPYILLENKVVDKTGVASNLVTSGDYLKLNDKIYRVVAKESAGIKLIYDGYYDGTYSACRDQSQYNNCINFGSTRVFNGSNIYNILNNQVTSWLGITTDERVVNATWDQGEIVDYGTKISDYLKTTGEKVTGKVGLIKVGEMLSGQSSTIENKIGYWTMTGFNSGSSIVAIDAIGNARSSISNYQFYAIRPVIVVKSDVNITGGAGTLSKPYNIGS